MADFIVAGTGSRSLATASDEHKRAVFAALKRRLAELQAEHGDNLVVLSGMAEGWDEAIIFFAQKLGIRTQAAVPNRGYGEYYWGRNSRLGTNRLDIFNNYLKQTEEVTYVCSTIYENGVHANFVRNTYMVNRADMFLVYNPSSSGTKHCVAAIQKAGVPYEVITA